MKTAKIVSASLSLIAAATLFKTTALMALSVFATLMFIDALHKKNGILPMSLLLTDEEKVTFVVAPQTKAGNPAHLDGPPSWEVSNPDVLELVVAEDGLSATVVAKGLGTARVTAKADADLDTDWSWNSKHSTEVRELISVEKVLFVFPDVIVVAAEASSLGMVAGVPELK